MEDRDFFDVLYQGWSKTTGAEDTFWMPEEYHLHYSEEGYPIDPPDKVWRVSAVDAAQHRRLVGDFQNEADAAFITAVHGCFADLTRRLHTALDEADRWEHERDSQECRIAELVTENQELRETIEWQKRACYE